MYLLLLLGAGIMVLPFLWMLSTSVMTIGEANCGPAAAPRRAPDLPLREPAQATTEGTVTDFAVSPEVREGEQELHTDSYYVEVAAGTSKPRSWQFRLVNNKAEPVAIVPVGPARRCALTDDWQPIPDGGGAVDTGRGLSFTFAPPAAYPATPLDRRSGAARTDYVNCCEYPTDVLEKQLAERAEREYTGRPIPEDLSNCRTAGRKVGYFLLRVHRRQLLPGLDHGQLSASTCGTASASRPSPWSGILIVSTLAAYAFARMNFPGRNFLFALLLSTMMIPETVTMIPNFLTITGNNPFLPFINWYDNWPALTIPFMAGFFNIFLLRQFFAQIPDELWDAARIDGAGHLRFLIQVVLPLSKAPIMTVIIFAFIGSWNALLWPLIATKAGSDWWPISVGLQNFVSEAGPETHLWMAGASISMLPVLILYFLAQKQFIEGIATTGLKG